MVTATHQSPRIFSRVMALELTPDELAMVGGGDPGPAGTCWECQPNNIGPGGGDTKQLIRD